MDKSKIRIVKKTDAAAMKGKKRRAKKTRAAAGEIVATVTGWVSDLKVRKSDEARAAFDLLFSVNRQATDPQ